MTNNNNFSKKGKKRNSLDKWYIMCGGITEKHKTDIIDKLIRNRNIDRKLLNINYKINSIIYELNYIKSLEEKKDKKTLNTKLEEIENLINTKNSLIKIKDEML